MNTRRATDVAIEDEIELTDVVELPEGDSLPPFQESELEEEKQDVFNSEMALHFNEDKSPPEKSSVSTMVPDDEISDFLSEDRVDTLTALFEDEKYTSNVSQLYEEEPSLSEILQEDLLTDVGSSAHSSGNSDTMDAFTVQEDLPSKKRHAEEIVLVEEPASADVETLEKLDNLDAMISSIITDGTTLSDVKNTLMDTVSAISDTVLEDLKNRIDQLESNENISTGRTIEFSLDDATVVEQIKTIFSREFDEKYTSLDTKVASLSPRLDAIEDHLQGLLILSKRVNTLESTLDVAVSKIENEASGYAESVSIEAQETLNALAVRMESIEETKDAFSILHQRFQKLEDGAKEYKNGSLIELEARYIELESKMKELFSFVEDLQKEKVDDTMLILGERIARLEGNIELLAKEKADVSAQSIKKEIEDSLRASIEKEATIAAARIIREELQALLEE